MNFKKKFLVCICVICMSGCSSVMFARKAKTIDDCGSWPAWVDTNLAMASAGVAIASERTNIFNQREELRDSHVYSAIGVGVLFSIAAAVGYYEYLDCMENSQ